MSAVSEANQGAGELDKIDARVLKLSADVDSLAVLLPRAFSKSRLETVRIMAKAVPEQSQAVLLSLRLGRPPAEIIEAVEALRTSLAQLRLLCSRTRVEQGAMLSIVLMEKLTASLSADLNARSAQQVAAPSAR